MPAEYQAVIYKSEAEEPLISKEEQCEASSPIIGADDLTRFKSSSFVLGIVVGFFIQFSTLGANYLALSLMGEAILSVTQPEFNIFSLICSVLTCAMAVVVVAFLRKMIFTTYIGKDIEDIDFHMECHYVVGALIGVCTAWAATDVALGMTAQAVDAVVTLVTALSCCRLMIYYFASEQHDCENEYESDEILIV